MSDKLKKQAAHSLTRVVDDTTGEAIEINETFRATANNIQHRIEGATIVTAILIQIVRDEKLYLALGCGSFKEYADTMLPFGRQAAYKYVKIAEYFAPLLPGVNAESVASMRQIEENIASDESVERLGELGMSKLYELTKMPEADFTEIMSRDVVKLEDGTEWSLEDIKSESARRVAEKVKRYRDELKAAEGEINTIAKERDDVQAENERLKKEAAEGLRYKRQYEAEDQSYGMYKQKLGKIAELAGALNREVTNTKDLPAFKFEQLGYEMRQAYKALGRARDNLKAQNLEAFSPDAQAYNPHDELISDVLDGFEPQPVEE